MGIMGSFMGMLPIMDGLIPIMDGYHSKMGINGRKMTFVVDAPLNPKKQTKDGYHFFHAPGIKTSTRSDL